MSSSRRLLLTPIAILAPLMLAQLACGAGRLADSGTTVDTADAGPDCSEAGASVEDEGFRLVRLLQLSVVDDVDVLFVVDNSMSMGPHQAKLAAAIGGFVDELEARDIDYRIGVTTTDNGNPWCPAGTTTPEAGKLVLSSCKDRIGEFMAEIDDFTAVCNDACSLDAAALEIQPTTTDVDAAASPRPWIQRDETRSNLPASTDVGEAMGCFIPQGVSGCGFESPLESMYLALIRAQNEDEESYGFLRADAVLAVVFLTDEADCSYNKDYSTIFEQDGARTFWSDPGAAFPSSAVCWNAGVECVGDPSAYTSCDPSNKDASGNVDVGDANAVLHPMVRYLRLLEGLEQQKQELNPDQEILVTVIAGFDAGNPEPWSVTYADVGDTDPAFQDSFGIGPGCVDAEAGGAVPPVRLRALGEGMQSERFYSICDPDLGPALTATAVAIDDMLLPGCYTECVSDTDPSTEVVDPGCTVERDPPGQETVRVDECLRDQSGAYVVDPDTGEPAMPADAVDVCFAMLVDPDGAQTPDPIDDMSPECADINVNLEFRLVHRPGVADPGGTSYTVDCYLEDCPDLACPGIGF